MSEAHEEHGSMNEKDEYVESRFEFNEKLRMMNQFQLIRLINRMMDASDREQGWTLEITEEEHQEILKTNNNEEEDNE